MLPSRGNCHAVFLLVRAANLRSRVSFDDWIRAAAGQSTFMSAALDLRSAARKLVEGRLAIVKDHVEIDARLRLHGEEANMPTLLAIARALLKAFPPLWLLSAVSTDGLILEHVPTDDWRALEWIGGDLEEVLIEITHPLLRARDERITSALGCLAELVVLKSKQNQGFRVVHVSQISDAFGYDIEVFADNTMERIEVKGALTTTGGQFFISRNEYEKSRAFGSQWYVLQVIFKPSILAREVVTIDDVVAVTALSAEELQKAVGLDSPTFSWTDRGKVSPPQASWTNEALSLQREEQFFIKF